MWDTSRASREPEDWFAFLRRCRDGNILIYITTEERTYDVTIARDWKTLADSGVDNAYESEKKSRDVKRGMAANAAAGMPHGVRQYGFERTHGPRTGVLTGQGPIPGEAAIAAEIIRRIAAAEPVSAITADLNQRGIPSHGWGEYDSGKWCRRSVRRVASSVAYIGMPLHRSQNTGLVGPALLISPAAAVISPRAASPGDRLGHQLPEDPLVSG